jgi:hypothetical protein
VGKANRARRKMKEKERKRATPRSAGGAWAPNDQPTLQELAAFDIGTALGALAQDDRRAFEVASARLA